MRKVTVAAIQMACSPDAAENRRTAEAMVRQAAGNGAQIILLPELFETPLVTQCLLVVTFHVNVVLSQKKIVRLL